MRIIVLQRLFSASRLLRGAFGGGSAMISFIIPAYNEELLLGQTLRAVNDAAGALGERFEVIVADDASTDRTAAIAQEHGARVVSSGHWQIAATRNTGARAANGEMLLFVDADTTVNQAAVRAALQAMRQGAVGGGCAFRFDGRVPLYGRILAAVAIPLYRVLRLASGCFLFCTRPAFHAVGGFDEGLYGAEEAVMSRRLGRQGRFVVLREVVTTSGRKLRAYSAREVLGLLARLACAGRNAVRQRQGLELWYGERRADPGFSAERSTTADRPRD
jgi:glycosyltransferase involved in cell wall biosynthesis